MYIGLVDRLHVDHYLNLPHGHVDRSLLNNCQAGIFSALSTYIEVFVKIVIPCSTGLAFYAGL